MSAGSRVTVLAGGHSVYVFNDGDERIEAQYMTMAGAGLDVEGVTVTGEHADRLLAGLAFDSVNVIDVRRSV